MSVFFNELGFTVIRTEDANGDELDRAHSEILKYVNDPKHKTLLYVYYTGHGAMDTLTKIVCNV